MHDQAKVLRGLMEHRGQSALPPDADSSCHRVTVASGKGGVGKTNIALNLAIALAQHEVPVLLLDVNWGVGTIELLCGRSSGWNLSHVLRGARRLDEILVPGPAGVTIVPGAGSLAEHPQDSSAARAVSDLLLMLEKQFPFVIVDLGTGLDRGLRRFVADSDRLLVVTTPEPPSIAEAYALIKSHSSTAPPECEVLINQAPSRAAAEGIFQRLDQTTRAFLQKELIWAGWVPQDSHVASAVALRRPFVLETPDSPASEAVRQTARRFFNQTRPSTRPSIPNAKFSPPSAETFRPPAVPCV